MGKTYTTGSSSSWLLYKNQSAPQRTPASSEYSRNIRKRKSKTQHNVTKHDLSIETDFCILRRFYKNKNNRRAMTNPESEYSELPNDEMRTQYIDDSASGDINSKTNIQLDITKMMMKNLQYLLNDWIKNYLQDNKETKDKLESAVNSIINKAERSELISSSKSIYYNREYGRREVKNIKGESRLKCCLLNSEETKKKKVKTSCHTTPGVQNSTLPQEYYRIISTLSVPRNVHTNAKEEEFDKPKKAQHKKLVLAFERSANQFSNNISNVDLLTVSAKSFTRRCATCDFDKKCKKDKTRRIVTKALLRSAKDSNFDTIANASYSFKEDNLDYMPSLLKHLYANNPSNFTSTNNFKNVASVKDDCTMTDFGILLEEPDTISGNIYDEIMNPKLYKNLQNLNDNNNDMSTKIFENSQTSQTMCTSDFIQNFIKQHLNNLLINKSDSIPSNTKPEMIKQDVVLKNKKVNRINRYRVSKYQRIRNKRFAYHYRIPPKDNLDSNYCKQNTFKYVVDETGSNNLKLDIQIKIVPTLMKETNIEAINADKFTIMSNHVISNAEGDIETIIEDVIISSATAEQVLTSNSNDNQCIVPILDGAASQVRYIFKSDSSTTESDTHNEITSISTPEEQISKEVSDLKGIIKNLTVVAETFLKEYLNNKAKKVSTSKARTVSILSKGIQYENEIRSRPTAIKPSSPTGIKLSIEPKRNSQTKESKKTTSISKEPKNPSELYHRLMKKSTSYKIIPSESVLKVTDMTSAANSSLKSEDMLIRSKSLIDISSENNMAYLTYYYKQTQKVESEKSTPVAQSSSCKKPHGYSSKSIEEEKLNFRENHCPEVAITVLDYSEDFDDVKVSSPKVIGLIKGTFYCLLTLSLILVLLYILYINILKQNPVQIYPVTSPKLVKRQTVLRPSDLGF